jgi:UDP-glucose 4-epimerase
MKILITGGAGFVGSNLLDELLKLGHECAILDNFSTGKHSNIPLDILTKDPVDISNGESVRMFFEYFMPDVVVHAAASYKDPDNWAEDAKTNVVGTANICYLSKKYKIQRLIYLQTSLCYGLNSHVNGRFSFKDPIPIDCPLDPTPDSYAITKTAAERLIAISGVPFISFRLSNCYGPRNLNGAIPAIYKKIKAGEPPFIVETRRSFIYISDLVDLLIRAIRGGGRRNYYHVSYGKDNSIMDLYLMMKKILKIECPLPIIKEKALHEVFSLLLDPRETFQDFPGWFPNIVLEEGIKRSIKWYDVNGIEETYTHLGVR